MRPAVVNGPCPAVTGLGGPRQLKDRGSPDWCWQTVYYLKDCVRHVDEEWRQAEQVLEDLAETRAWQVIPPGEPYGTIDKMLKAEIGLEEHAVKDLISQGAPRGSQEQRSPSTEGGNGVII